MMSTSKSHVSNKGCSLNIVLLIEGILAVVIGIFIFLYMKNRDALIFSELIFGLFALTVVGATCANSCPSCHRILVKRRLHDEEIERKKGYRTVEREEKNRSGNVIRRWDEQIQVMTVTYRHHYKCKNCASEWSTTSTKEFDSFDE
jgi:DNA-directed RNA polymerase subunit RPC12/RpoP